MSLSNLPTIKSLQEGVKLQITLKLRGKSGRLTSDNVRQTLMSRLSDSSLLRRGISNLAHMQECAGRGEEGTVEKGLDEGRQEGRQRALTEELERSREEGTLGGEKNCLEEKGGRRRGQKYDSLHGDLT